MSDVIQTIQLDARAVLDAINGLLPTLEAAIPAIASVGGPIGLGLSAASLLLPLLSKIPIGPVYTVEMQASYLQRVQALALLDFSGPQWVPTKTPGETPQVPPAG